jgi:hypothetical protein
VIWNGKIPQPSLYNRNCNDTIDSSLLTSSTAIEESEHTQTHFLFYFFKKSNLFIKLNTLSMDSYLLGPIYEKGSLLI